MLKIEYRELASLQVYAGNPRTHSDDQIARLVASIQEFGFINPILVDEEGVIIAGHGRREAAELCDLDEVPTITLDGLNEDQKRALVIADNKLTELGGWSPEKLLAEFKALASTDFDTDLLGFSEAEMTKLFADKSSGTGENSPVIQYQIVFDNEEQQDRFYRWLAFLRANGNGDTIAERIDAHICDAVPALLEEA